MAIAVKIGRGIKLKFRNMGCCFGSSIFFKNTERGVSVMKDLKLFQSVLEYQRKVDAFGLASEEPKGDNTRANYLSGQVMGKRFR